MIAFFSLAGSILLLIYLENELVGIETASALSDVAASSSLHKAIGYMLDLNSYFINWSALIIGVTTISILSNVKVNEGIELLSISFGLLSIISAVGAIWLGTLVVENVVLLLSLDQNPLKSTF